jgi:hypothetical protein
MTLPDVIRAPDAGPQRDLRKLVLKPDRQRLVGRGWRGAGVTVKQLPGPWR